MAVKNFIAGLVGAGLVLGMAPAFAGEWRLNERACPDLVEDHFDRREDRRDARYDYNRRDVREDRSDRRENRRDARLTVCPRSAFVYVADRGESVRYDSHRGRGRAYGRQRTPRLTLAYDRRIGLNYHSYNGRRVYIRG